MKRSSSTPPSSRHSTEYWAPPSASSRDVVGEDCCRNASAPGAGGLDLAHVRDVEDARRARGRPVLLADARRTGPASPSRRTGTSLAPAATWRSCSGRALQRLGAGGHARPDPSTGWCGPRPRSGGRAGYAAAVSGRAALAQAAQKASTTTGSNCVPAQRAQLGERVLRRARRAVRARSAVIASKASATATMRDAERDRPRRPGRRGSPRRPSARGSSARARRRGSSAGAAAMIRSPISVWRRMNAHSCVVERARAC